MSEAPRWLPPGDNAFAEWHLPGTGLPSLAPRSLPAPPCPPHLGDLVSFLTTVSPGVLPHVASASALPLPETSQKREPLPSPRADQQPGSSLQPGPVNSPDPEDQVSE